MAGRPKSKVPEVHVTVMGNRHIRLHYRVDGKRHFEMFRGQNDPHFRRVVEPFLHALDDEERAALTDEALRGKLSGKAKHTASDKTLLKLAKQVARAMEADLVKEYRRQVHVGRGPDLKSRSTVVEYMEAITDAIVSKPSQINHLSALKHVRCYEKDRNTQLRHVNAEYLQGFTKWVTEEARTYDPDCTGTAGKRLARKTALGYAYTLRSVIKKAMRDGVLPFMDLGDVKVGKGSPRRNEGRIKYLTPEQFELLRDNMLEDRPQDVYSRRQTCEAFILACHIGARVSDWGSLTWGDIEIEPGRNVGRVRFTARKTGQHVTAAITDTALDFLRDIQERRETTANDDPIFPLLAPLDVNGNVQTINRHLETWGRSVGLKEKLTSHMARHTCATLHLSLGYGTAWVQKQLGHASVTETEKYAKLLDEARIRDAERIGGI